MKIGTAHVEVKPVLNQDEMDKIEAKFANLFEVAATEVMRRQAFQDMLARAWHEGMQRARKNVDAEIVR